MKRLILAVAALCTFAGAAHTFEVSEERDAFLLDGEKFQIRCGELHFARIPRAYWRHRIKMCKALGLNAVCAYMFWNYHEMERGEYDFSGEKDVAAFCRMAQEEGMWVVLRPGPYTCAEWEFGGHPWWLISNGPIQLRSRDQRYLEPAKAWLRRVGEELRDLQITHGGPILMVQDENEYGFFGSDDEYIRELYKTLREAGFDVPIFTCNPATQMKKGAIPEVVKVVNFGANPQNGFARLREVQPKGPLMCGEYYPAWFDSWGQRHHTKPAKAMIDDIDYMLSVGGSFSLYMAHGGTTFGWWAGCNSPFQPQTSSYDYEAPISEQGRTTPKFFALRDLLKKYMSQKELASLPEPPEPYPLMAFKSDAQAELVTPQLRTLKLGMAKPQNFEELGVGYGAIVYTPLADVHNGGILKAPNLRDQAAVYVDGDLVGFLDRRFPSRGVKIPRGTKTLHILATHMSRYCFGSAMNHTEKGLGWPVTLDGKELEGWNAQAIAAPLESEPCHIAANPFNFKRFCVTFPAPTQIEKQEKQKGENYFPDTFLLVRGWKKGHVWVNGHPLGRFWGIGPTQTMFVPGCWLKEGENEFLVFDFGGNVPMEGLTFVDTPVLDEMHPELDLVSAPQRDSKPFTPPENPTAQGEFPDAAEAQEVKFSKIVKCRTFAFVADSAWHGGDVAAIGEFELIDSKGESIAHDKWKFISVSSEETAKEDCVAENAIDGQISNFWHSRWSDQKPKAPHYLVIDLGGETEVAGFRYTPRQSHRNGRIRAWRVYGN